MNEKAIVKSHFPTSQLVIHHRTFELTELDQHSISWQSALPFGEYPETTVVKVTATDECPESAVREFSLVHE